MDIRIKGFFFRLMLLMFGVLFLFVCYFFKIKNVIFIFLFLAGVSLISDSIYQSRRYSEFEDVARKIYEKNDVDEELKFHRALVNIQKKVGMFMLIGAIVSLKYWHFGIDGFKKTTSISGLLGIFIGLGLYYLAPKIIKRPHKLFIIKMFKVSSVLLLIIGVIIFLYL